MPGSEPQQFRALLQAMRDGDPEARLQVLEAVAPVLLELARFHVVQSLQATTTAELLVETTCQDVEQHLSRFLGSNWEEFLAWCRALLLLRVRELRRNLGLQVVHLSQQPLNPDAELSACDPTGQEPKAVAGQQPLVPLSQPFPLPLSNHPICIGGYQIEGILGEGGMGVVYLARDMKLKRQVAVKYLPLTLFHQAGRFTREAEALGRLQHPHIVQIFESGLHEGHPFLAMEFLPGGSLKEWIHRGLLSSKRIAKILSELARGIQATHDRGIIHRDLKPSNVLICRAGTAKITDFGLARFLESEERLTRSGAALGTPSYMAPEQAIGNNRAIGPTTDVYGLGAILYELLTARPPFVGELPLAVLHQVIHNSVVSPRQLNPAVPVELETICLKCLEKQPSQRYASAAELADDLDRYLAGEAILARPPSWLTSLQRRVRRYPLSAGLSALVVLLVVTSLIVLTWLWQVAERQREQAILARQAADDLAAGEREARQQAIVARQRFQKQLYLSDMARLPADWRENRLESMRLTLQRHVPVAADSPDLRHFEWAYWKKRQSAHSATLRLEHDAPLRSVVCSSDGRQLLCTDHPGNLYLWDLASGKRLRQWPRPFPMPEMYDICAVGDGYYLVTHSGKLLSIPRTDSPLPAPQSFPLRQDTNRYRLLAIDSRSGQVAFLSSNTTAVDVFEITSRRHLATYQLPVSQVVSAAMSERHLVVSSINGQVWLFNKQTKEAIQLPGYRPLTVSRFDQAGNYLAINCLDREVGFWDLKGKPTSRVLAPIAKVVTALAFDDQGQRLLGGCNDGTVVVWEVSRGTLLREMPCHEGWVTAGRFLPGSTNEIVTAGSDQVVCRWELNPSTFPIERKLQLPLLACMREWPVHHALVVSSSVTKSPGLLISLIDLSSSPLEWMKDVQHFACHPSADRLALVQRDGSLQVRDRSGKLLRTSPPGVHLGPVDYIASGQQLAVITARMPQRIAVLDAETLVEQPTKFPQPDEILTLRHLTSSRANDLLAFTSYQRINQAIKRRVEIWNKDASKRLVVQDVQESDIPNMALAPSGSHLVVGLSSLLYPSHPATLTVYEMPTGHRLTTLIGLTGRLSFLGFSADGRRLGAGTDEGVFRLWDTETWQEVLTIRPTGVQSPTYWYWSRDGRNLVEAFGDTLRLWQVSLPESLTNR